MAKLLLTNGETVERPILSCVGFVTTEITLYAQDLRNLRALFEHNPREFGAALFQLEARFAENRVPLKAVTHD